MKTEENVLTATLLDKIISRHKDQPGFLLSTLEEAQKLNPHRYLPEETLTIISRKLNIPYSQVYSVATFYSFFNLAPQGDHTITICRGTACHTKGSKALLDDVNHFFDIKPEEVRGKSSFTTKDNLFTIKTVACFGQCALSPVVAIDDVIYSNMNSQKLQKIIEVIRKKKKK